MDHDKLIHCLKCCARVDAQNVGCDDCGLEYCGEECQQLCGTAATALSTLQAENAQLRAYLEYEQEHANAYHEECGQWEAENEKLRAELEQVKAERDAAVECIRGIAKSGRVWMCSYCVHAKDTTGGITECELDVGVCMMPYSKFEWCSHQKED